ncbi:hypothetical protein H0H81_008330 [Sphagnurus paluster]|uniref:Probable alpha/beta-glucosidase agdC n=1 Tax=Sphagnurus paluster TaxID=117069 RepID=A0A9P7GRF1_9AGAR|nr:hypothetical protein H0H81_008330 [Sphagnurus paluster]
MAPKHLWERLRIVLLAAFLQTPVIFGTYVDPKVLDACSGYRATNVKNSGATLTADLLLNGQGCNIFGQDIKKLSLKVVYETDSRIHVKIIDAAATRFEVPETIVPRPAVGSVGTDSSAIQFNYTASPFSFSIYRTASREVLFSTATHPLIFEPQYLRVKTTLPSNPNIYGLGEHTHPFHLPTDNTTLTLWSRDAYGIPVGTNLYGNHPVYFEHRTTGTHGVFLLNANGMDIKLTKEGSASSLEYNVIGGVLDFYFLAGSTTDPTAVARQYAEVVGRPAEVPYWSFGLHQCRFGYKDFVDVAGVISNYASSGIPLETMWTDIDYMDRRRVFTIDPDYFPIKRMREIVDYLHAHDQKYIVMTDPAVAYLPGDTYGAYNRGTQLDIWVKAANGSASLGLVWPGKYIQFLYAHWFHPKVGEYWNKEFDLFYNPKTGLDIDGVWIDMNEPASFCELPCTNPFEQAVQQKLPPPRSSPPPKPDTPIFVQSSPGKTKRDDILNPPYAINNAAGPLSGKTAFTDSKHANGLTEYDAHNLYGTMMSTATYKAMLARRPGKRTFVITRSTYAGAGKEVGKWLGDNLSLWEHYRISIAGMLGFASIYQIPMVGSDICGFGADTTENLCARWAMLGAFYPFMRNHNQDTSISQEFYRWASVTQAAKNTLDIRYRLIDYIYTAFHQANLDGTPVLHPLWFKYPKDTTTFSIDLQFFYGDSLLVSPVTQDDSTSVTFYLPRDIFYDFATLAPVKGTGAPVTLNNVSFTQIPLHIKGGSVLPLRAKSAMTTTELRKRDFEFIVAPGTDGTASGSLYIDDGESIKQTSTTSLKLVFRNGRLSVQGVFGYQSNVKTSRVRFLGVATLPNNVQVNGKAVAKGAYAYDRSKQVLDVTVGLPLTAPFNVEYS